MAVRDVLGIFEAAGKQYYRDYQVLQAGVKRLWGMWKEFRNVDELNATTMLKAPIFFDFTSLIRRMNVPKGVRKAAAMAAIRARARAIQSQAVDLQQKLEEMQQKWKDQQNEKWEAGGEAEREGEAGGTEEEEEQQEGEEGEGREEKEEKNSNEEEEGGGSDEGSIYEGLPKFLPEDISTPLLGMLEEQLNRGEDITVASFHVSKSYIVHLNPV